MASMATQVVEAASRLTMRVKHLAMCFSLLLFAGSAAHAQSGEMSDLELSAAYCFAYQKDSRGSLAKLRQNSVDASNSAQRDVSSPDPNVRTTAEG